MKKILTLILAAAVMLTACPTYADSFIDIEPDAPYKEAIETVTALGIMENTGAQSFSPKKSVSRGEFLKYALALSGLDISSEGEQDSGFYDVPAQHEYAREIAAARSIGMISGDGNGFFFPDAGITYADSAKILAYVTGYGKVLGYGKDSSSAYVEFMNKQGISKKLSLRNNDVLSRGVCALLLYNTLFVPVFQGKKYTGQSIEYYTNDEETVLSEYLGLYYTDGRVTANRRIALDKYKNADTNTVDIEFETYEAYDGFDDSLLGCYVRAYFKDDGGIRTLVHAQMKPDNEITEIEADKLISCSQGTLTYENASGRNSRKSIPKNIYVIYNEEPLFDWSYSDLEPEMGTVTVLDNDGDGTADIVFVNEYKNYIITAVKQSEEKVYFKNERPLDFSDNDISIAVRDSSAGNPLAIKDLKSDTLVSVIKSKSGKNITIYTNNASITGVLQTYNEDTVVIDSKSYSIAKEFDAKAYLGRSITVLLDYKGKAAALPDDIKPELAPGFILSAGYDTSEENAWVKILTADGETERYVVSDKVRVDGDRSGLLGGAWVKISSDNLIKVLAECSALSGREANVSQLVRYKINGDNEISEIDTGYYRREKETEDSLQLSKKVTSEDNRLQCRAGGVLEGEFNVSTDAKVFLIPATVEKRNSSNDITSVKTGTYFEMDERYPITGTNTGMEFYNFNDVNTTDLAVVYMVDGVSGIGTIGGNYRTCVMAVEEVFMTLDESDTATYEISGVTVNGRSSYKLTENLIEKMDVSEIHSGDVIAYEMIGSKISNIKKLFTYNSSAPYSRGAYNGQNSSFYGKLRSCDGSYMALDFAADDTEKVLTFWLPPSNLTLLSYDTDTKKYSFITPDDLVGSLQTGGVSNNFYVYTNWSRPYMIIEYTE